MIILRCSAAPHSCGCASALAEATAGTDLPLHPPAHTALPAGFAAVVAAILFFLATFLSPLFGQIPQIATSPILVLVGVLIFASAVGDIDWEDMIGEWVGGGWEEGCSPSGTHGLYFYVCRRNSIPRCTKKVALGVLAEPGP
jgi:hypothetical protein